MCPDTACLAKIGSYTYTQANLAARVQLKSKQTNYVCSYSAFQNRIITVASVFMLGLCTKVVRSQDRVFTYSGFAKSYKQSSKTSLSSLSGVMTRNRIGTRINQSVNTTNAAQRIITCVSSKYPVVITWQWHEDNTMLYEQMRDSVAHLAGQRHPRE